MTRGAGAKAAGTPPGRRRSSLRPAPSSLSTGTSTPGSQANHPSSHRKISTEPAPACPRSTCPAPGRSAETARLATQDEPLAERDLLALAEREQRGDIIVRDVPEAAGGLAEEFPGDAPGQGGDDEGQGLQIQKDVPPVAEDELVGELADETVEQLVVLAHDAGQPRQVGDDLRLVATGKLRQELGPDAVAEETEVAVRRVLPEMQALGIEPGAEVRAGDSEKRPNDRAGLAGDDRRDPGQPGQARPPHQSHDNGFGLVGHRVAGGDLGRPGRRRGPPQEVIAELTPGLLEVQLPSRRERPDVGRLDVQRKDPAAGQVVDEAHVLPRFVPEPVVEMSQADLERHVLTELQEKRDQGDGIGPPGQGGEDAVAGDDKTAVDGRLPEGGENAIRGFLGCHRLIRTMGARAWRNGGGGI